MSEFIGKTVAIYKVDVKSFDVKSFDVKSSAYQWH